MANFRSVSFVLLLGVVSSSMPGQAIGTNKEQGRADTFTLSVRSQLVVETVTVKDKQGNPVQGLTAFDFTLTEDGVPQKIRYCEHLTLLLTAAPLAPRPRNHSLDWSPSFQANVKSTKDSRSQ